MVVDVGHDSQWWHCKKVRYTILKRKTHLLVVVWLMLAFGGGGRSFVLHSHLWHVTSQYSTVMTTVTVTHTIPTTRDRPSNRSIWRSVTCRENFCWFRFAPIRLSPHTLKFALHSSHKQNHSRCPQSLSHVPGSSLGRRIWFSLRKERWCCCWKRREPGLNSTSLSHYLF
jgi:hypothetical protein